MPCAAPGCERDAVAKRLCLKHYKRVRAGLPLVPGGLGVGAQSGFGHYGMLDDDGDTVLCHECGLRYVHVGAHLRHAHQGLTSAEYKRVHGLTQGTSLVAGRVREVQSQHARDRVQAGAASWRRLEDSRDPAAATTARLSERARRRAADDEEAADALAALGAGHPHSRRRCPVCGGRDLTEGGQRSGGTCGDPECVAARREAGRQPKMTVRDARVVADHGAGDSPRVLAERYGVSVARIQQILRAQR